MRTRLDEARALVQASTPLDRQVDAGPYRHASHRAGLDSGGAAKLLELLASAHQEASQGSSETIRAEAIAIATHALENARPTEIAREALRAFIAAQASPERPAGVFARWFGRSPAPAAYPSFGAAIGAGLDVTELARNPKAALLKALAAIDPALAEVVVQDSKYHVGVSGAARHFPELKEALDQFQHASDAQRERAMSFMREALLPIERSQAALVGLVAEVRAGKSIDMKTAIDLARAGVLEVIGPSELRKLVSAAQGSEVGLTYARAFARFFDGSARTISTAAGGARHAVSALLNPLRLFDDALAVVDPKLAELGHTTLHFGPYPEAQQVYEHIAHMGDESEEPTRDALAIAQAILTRPSA